MNCNQEKKTPKEIDKYSMFTVIVLCPYNIARCAATKATPELIKTKVFTKGNIVGFSVSKSLIPTGGHILPNAMDGDKLP
jgi:hypothetical protein